MIGNRVLLQFNVNKQVIERLDNNILISGSQNFVYIKFEFSDEWKGLDKDILFNNIYQDSPLSVVIDGDTVQVPNEYVAFPGFTFSVQGIGENITITTQTKMIDVNLK